MTVAGIEIVNSMVLPTVMFFSMRNSTPPAEMSFVSASKQCVSAHTDIGKRSGKRTELRMSGMEAEIATAKSGYRRKKPRQITKVLPSDPDWFIQKTPA